MEVNVLLPQLGNEIEEAQVDAWLKSVGDVVAKATPKNYCSTFERLGEML